MLKDKYIQSLKVLLKKDGVQLVDISFKNTYAKCSFYQVDMLVRHHKIITPDQCRKIRRITEEMAKYCGHHNYIPGYVHQIPK